jgi:hypothetical protein
MNNANMGTGMQVIPCCARQMLDLYALQSKIGQCYVMVDSCAEALQYNLRVSVNVGMMSGETDMNQFVNDLSVCNNVDNFMQSWTNERMNSGM